MESDKCETVDLRAGKEDHGGALEECDPGGCGRP